MTCWREGRLLRGGTGWTGRVFGPLGANACADRVLKRLRKRQQVPQRNACVIDTRPVGRPRLTAAPPPPPSLFPFAVLVLRVPTSLHLQWTHFLLYLLKAGTCTLDDSSNVLGLVAV